MKLNEIYTDKGIQEFIEHMKQYGEVHQGGYSYVYAPEGKDYVYKAWTHDPAWEAYVDIISKHKNPYFPVISKIKAIPLHLARDIALVDTKVKIAKIEKLKPLPKSKNFICKATKNGLLVDLQLSDVISCKNSRTLFSIYDISEEDKQKYKDLFDVVDILNDLISSNKLYGWDAAGDNILMRANGHIVFADPICTTDSDWTNSTLVDYGKENRKTVFGRNTKAPTLDSAAQVMNAYTLTTDVMKQYFPLFNKIGVLASLSQKEFNMFLKVCPKDNDIIFDFILSDQVTRKKNKTKFVQSFTRWYRQRFQELEEQWFDRNLKYSWQDYIYSLDEIDTKLGDAAMAYIEQGRKEHGYESLNTLPESSFE
jgi:hypothetical protein